MKRELEVDDDHHCGSGGNLETVRAERSVWLMKSPVSVAKSWQAASASSSDSNPIAKVILSLDLLHRIEPDKPPDPLCPDRPPIEYMMEIAGGETGNLRKSYSLNMFHDVVPMCVFSETNQGKLSMEGRVEKKFDMKPCSENMEEYGKLCRERTNKYTVKSRQIQVIDNDRGVLMRPMPGQVTLISSNNKEKKKPAMVKQPEVKRTRRDRGELEDIMFKLFERQPNWALKQLVQETDQPAQFLKEILNELCVYNKRGSNQGTYELKPEYKKSAEEAGAE